jgi:hypothetical protein
MKTARDLLALCEYGPVEWDWVPGAKQMVQELSPLFAEKLPTGTTAEKEVMLPSGWTAMFSVRQNRGVTATYYLSVGPTPDGREGAYRILIKAEETKEISRSDVYQSGQRSQGRAGALVRNKSRKIDKEFETTQDGLNKAKKYIASFKNIAAQETP